MYILCGAAAYRNFTCLTMSYFAYFSHIFCSTDVVVVSCPYHAFRYDFFLLDDEYKPYFLGKNLYFIIWFKLSWISWDKVWWSWSHIIDTFWDFKICPKSTLVTFAATSDIKSICTKANACCSFRHDDIVSVLWRDEWMRICLYPH